MDKKGFLKLHQPCPCGKSSDAYSVNRDGSGHCFSCDKHFKGDVVIETQENLAYRYLPQRGLSESTMRFYNIKTKLSNDEPVEVGFPYPSGGFKIRSLQEKKFRMEGNTKQPGLFGKDKFDPGSRESITICEGEFDAPSIFEVTNGKTASTSVRSASQAYRDCIADRDYINSFSRIIICFDNDEPGQKAAREVSSLFDFNKVYHVKFTQYKDANDYLQNEQRDTLFQTWRNARRYSPDNIISTFEEIFQSLIESKEDQIGTYPFHGIQSATYGLHKGEIVVIKGRSGIGKTEIFRAMEHHLLKTTKSNIGIIHLEEDNATTIKAISGYELNVQATLPDCGLSNQDIFDGYKKAVGENDRRVHLYQSFELDEENIFLDNIRFLVTAAGCEFIFLDHIQWLATGLQNEDERLKLDRITQRLKLLAKELKFCLIMISHTNDEGRTRGSRNIENVANTMIDLVRDKMHPDEFERRVTHMNVEKVRLGGHTGPAGRSYLDPFSGVLRELQPEDEIRLPRH